MLAPADRVVGIRQQSVVVTDFERSDVVVIEAAGLRFEIEQDLLRRVETAEASRVHRVFIAGVEPAVIEISLVSIGDRRVVLADAGDDFRVESLFQRLQPAQHCGAVIVFRTQVREHGGLGARVVAQPVIVVATSAVRD